MASFEPAVLVELGVLLVAERVADVLVREVVREVDPLLGGFWTGGFCVGGF